MSRALVKTPRQTKLVMTPRGLKFSIRDMNKKVEQIKETFVGNSINDIDDSLQHVLLAIERNEEEKKN